MGERIRPAVVWWWSGGVGLQVLFVGWVVGHCGGSDVSRQIISRKPLFSYRVIVSLMERISSWVRRERVDAGNK